jgi:hypothetical protein
MKTAQTAYWYHKGRAKQRGIKFELTFTEWKTIWRTALGKNWMKKRGRYRGQYQMARFNDQGPYAIGNVEIKLGDLNRSENRYWKELHRVGIRCGPGVYKLKDLGLK